jgi:hypothetical protein
LCTKLACSIVAAVAHSPQVCVDDPQKARVEHQPEHLQHAGHQGVRHSAARWLNAVWLTSASGSAQEPCAGHPAAGGRADGEPTDMHSERHHRPDHPVNHSCCS